LKDVNAQPEPNQNAETNRIVPRRQILRAKILIEITHADPNLRPCGLIRRLAAMTYDGLLLIALWMIAAAVVVIPAGHEIEPGAPIFQLYLLVVAWAYLAICWRHGGQTLGMKAWRIRLLGTQQPVGWGTTAVRFVVAVASLLGFGIGFIWSLFHPRHATWHDLASGTYLVVEPKKSSQAPQHEEPENPDQQ
jgi:uncharacterized RDD family membrane protein YckC